jgi:hypothetical protein
MLRMSILVDVEAIYTMAQSVEVNFGPNAAAIYIKDGTHMR